MSLPTTTANWPSRCPGCGEDIAVGDPIVLVEGDWVCEDCAEGTGGAL